ncbi:MAG: hypothetical protein H2069_10525 [Legionella sp.]|nr:hypothetical protein [Legionella sp.]
MILRSIHYFLEKEDINLRAVFTKPLITLMEEHNCYLPTQSKNYCDETEPFTELDIRNFFSVLETSLQLPIDSDYNQKLIEQIDKIIEQLSNNSRQAYQMFKPLIDSNVPSQLKTKWLFLLTKKLLRELDPKLAVYLRVNCFIKSIKYIESLLSHPENKNHPQYAEFISTTLNEWLNITSFFSFLNIDLLLKALKDAPEEILSLDHKHKFIAAIISKKVEALYPVYTSFQRGTEKYYQAKYPKIITFLRMLPLDDYEKKPHIDNLVANVEKDFDSFCQSMSDIIDLVSVSCSEPKPFLLEVYDRLPLNNAYQLVEKIGNRILHLHLDSKLLPELIVKISDNQMPARFKMALLFPIVKSFFSTEQTYKLFSTQLIISCFTTTLHCIRRALGSSLEETTTETTTAYRWFIANTLSMISQHLPSLSYGDLFLLCIQLNHVQSFLLLEKDRNQALFNIVSKTLRAYNNPEKLPDTHIRSYYQVGSFNYKKLYFIIQDLPLDEEARDKSYALLTRITIDNFFIYHPHFQDFTNLVMEMIFCKSKDTDSITEILLNQMLTLQTLPPCNDTQAFLESLTTLRQAGVTQQTLNRFLETYITQQFCGITGLFDLKKTIYAINGSEFWEEPSKQLALTRLINKFIDKQDGNFPRQCCDNFYEVFILIKNTLSFQDSKTLAGTLHRFIFKTVQANDNFKIPNLTLTKITKDLKKTGLLDDTLKTMLQPHKTKDPSKSNKLRALLKLFRPKHSDQKPNIYPGKREDDSDDPNNGKDNSTTFGTVKLTK